MADSPQAEIESPQEGQPTNKLWETVAKLVKAITAWGRATVTPESAGKFRFADGNVVLDLSALAGKFPAPPAEGTWWLAAVDGVVSWQPTRTDCPEE